MSSTKSTKSDQQRADVFELDASTCKPKDVLQLVRDRGVVRLKRLQCDEDVKWACEVLRVAAPLLEEVDLLEPRLEHLALVHTMPRLGRLFLVFVKLQQAFPDAPTLPGGAVYWPALPALAHASVLETVSIFDRSGILPLAPLRALLRAHAASIKNLKLRGLRVKENKLPWVCYYGDNKGDDQPLPGAVDSWIALQCGLSKLRHLFLDDGVINGGTSIMFALEDADRARFDKSMRTLIPGVHVHWASMIGKSMMDDIDF